MIYVWMKSTKTRKHLYNKPGNQYKQRFSGILVVTLVAVLGVCTRALQHYDWHEGRERGCEGEREGVGVRGEGEGEKRGSVLTLPLRICTYHGKLIYRLLEKRHALLPRYHQAKALVTDSFTSKFSLVFVSVSSRL